MFNAWFLRLSAAGVSLALSSLAAFAASETDPDWWSSTQRGLTRQEYWASRSNGEWQAPNRSQNLRTWFRAGGIEVVPRATDSESWCWQWRTSAWGRENAMNALSTASPTPLGQRVEYRYAGIVEWYENRPEGLEQGFTIADRPEGTGPLRIEARVSPDLKARSSAEHAGIDFLDVRDACVLRYDGLRAFDARGRELEASLNLKGATVTIVVDDRGADYPVVVDPLMTTPSWTTEGNQTNAFYGYSVATAGDVNGDGFSDVIVGAINYDNGQFEEGRAFLYLGSASGLALSPAWTAEGNQAIARFGQSVASAGDVNGDGFGDVIVGAPQLDEGQSDEGKSFLYLGSASGLATSPAWTAQADQADAYFGISVATAGDVNGDGFSDVVIGAMGYDHGQTNEGRAFLYMGSASGLDPSPAWSAESDSAGSFFGRSVSTAGDVNADGFADVVVGARAYANGEIAEGRAFLYLGSASGLSLVPDWTAESNQIGAEFGYSVANAGDVNGDGYADVIIGARSYSNGQSSEGRAFVYLGSSSGLADSAAWTAESDDPGGQFGNSVSTAGDVNGDGFADVIIGSPLYGVTASRGRAYAYLGSAAGLLATPFWIADSDQDDAAFGFSVATAGDVNGDGFGDVLVGAELYNNGQSDEGRAFLYLGSGAGPRTSPAWSAESDQSYGYFGYSVASAGDVNADGFGDVIVSALYYDNGETDEGRTFLYLGSPAGLAAAPAWTAESDQANAHFGQSVASAGDVNGDGYGDVIVGCHQYDNGQDEEGRAYLYLGSASGLSSTPAWTAESNQALDRFGISVAGAGDVNGDGFGDVIVGAVYWHNPEFEEGRALVYYGSAAGLDTVPDWTAESNQGLAFFGYSVAGAGDVNGDGYSDVIVGAYAYDNGQANEGRAFVYLGSPTGLAATPAWTAESDQATAYFGFAVAGAGDVNGDGFDDVAASALLYDNDQSDEGRVFVYLGSAAGLATTPAWTTEGNQSSAQFGVSIARAGDVNGDGYDDFLIGSSAYDGGQSDEGRALLFLGSAAGLAATPAWSTEADQVFASLGNSVAAAGDVNGDGFADILIGAPYMNHDLIDEGRAFVYYGNAAGLDRHVRQIEADGVAPIAPLGAARSGGFRLQTLARSPAGRCRVWMEWEVERLGTAFDGVGSRTAAKNTGVPVPGLGSAVSLGALVVNLQLNAPYHWRLRVGSSSPFFPRSPWMTLAHNGPRETDLRTGPVSTAAPEPPVAGGALRFVSVRPNPSRSAFSLTYVLPRPGPVLLTIHDLQGRRVATLVNRGREDAGAHSRTWDGRDETGAEVRPGFYWVRLRSGGESRRAKLVRL